ncbi:MAG: hypothetical protein Q8P22_08625 [Chloroflexota bacterium]|nr:hypothetical protein [Chloroflexota bacterium]
MKKPEIRHHQGRGTILSWWRAFGWRRKAATHSDDGGGAAIHNMARGRIEEGAAEVGELEATAGVAEPAAVEAESIETTGGAPEPVEPAGRGQWLLWGSIAAGVILFGAGFFAAGFATRVMVEGGSSSSSTEGDALTAAVLPEKGVTVQARWGDVMPKLVELGVIDLEKFKAAAAQAGSPLTPEQLAILTEGSDENLTISAQNAHFMVNALWAIGLANKNAILEQGLMAQQGWDKRGNYAATGGWTLGKQPGGEYVSAFEVIPLTPEQQAIVEEVAYNSYRPCCGNPTAFPDCNHGAAALGLAYLMASQGASADEIFEAVKSFNAFWFPQQYYTLAVYFDRQGTSWKDVDPREVVDREHSSSRGFEQVRNQLELEGALPQTGGGGSSCGA